MSQQTVTPLRGSGRLAVPSLGEALGVLLALAVLGLATGAAEAQSSSLYVEGDRSPQRPTRRPAPQRQADRGNGTAAPQAPANRNNQRSAQTAGESGAQTQGRAASNGVTNAGPTPQRRQPGAQRPETRQRQRRSADRRAAAGPRPTRRGLQKVDGRIVNPHLQSGSYMAVVPPEPRKFEPQDLITIIIREEASATSEATLDTEKETTVEGEVGEFPRLRLKQLLQGIATSSRQEDLPAVDVTGTNEFQGEGEYERSDSMVTRLTARVVDVKPNGTLTLEARTEIQNDDENMTIKVTGTCRTEDITADNTILSTEMYDLRVDKQHEGELRDTSSKGLITNILETLFNF